MLKVLVRPAPSWFTTLSEVPTIPPGVIKRGLDHCGVLDGVVVCSLCVQLPAHRPGDHGEGMLPIVILSPLDPADAIGALTFGEGLGVAAA